MQIEPTGVIFSGRCEVQSEHCIARDSGALTAVWQLPARKQINVCRACLENEIRAGEWSISGARIPPHADVAVVGRDGALVLLVEVKWSPPRKDAEGWARQVRRNLVAHGALPQAPYFMLATYPGASFLWAGRAGSDPDVPPTASFDASTSIGSRLQASSNKGEALEQAVENWLLALVNDEEILPEPLLSTELKDKIRNGRVIRQYQLQL